LSLWLLRIGVMLRERVEISERLLVDLAAILTNAA
jgi:hypothetical protein